MLERAEAGGVLDRGAGAGAGWAGGDGMGAGAGAGEKLSAEHSTSRCYLGDTGLLVSLAFWDKEHQDNDLYRAILLDTLNVNEGMLGGNAVALDGTGAARKERAATPGVRPSLFYAVFGRVTKCVRGSLWYGRTSDGRTPLPAFPAPR